VALQLEREVKGILANYWAISKIGWDKASNQTNLTLSLYLSKTVRDQGLNNDLASQTMSFDGYLTIDEAYEKIKESKMEQYEITPAVYSEQAPYVYGQPYTPPEILTPAVMSTREGNPFTLAENA
jgi:hypothetical protein